MAIQTIGSTEPQPARSLALFELGFRPFFLLAGISAVCLVLFWIYLYLQSPAQTSYYPAILWHSHEMIFAYTMAVVAGFLLTAVRNWTGIQTIHGKALAALVLLWLGGRVLPFFAATVPHWLLALVDLAFAPTLALMIAIPLLRKRQQHNLVFLFVLGALTAANLMIHAQILGLTQSTATQGIRLAIYLIVFLIAIAGGRVIPFFTETAIAGAASRRWLVIEYASLAGLLFLMILLLLDADALIILPLAIFTAVAHSVRLYGWYHKAIWSQPLLWILHLAYAWLILGLVLQALAAAGLVNPMLAIHAFTTAGIGSMTLGMMARVSLGHTGRELRSDSATTLAFICISLAGLTRVILPMFYPTAYREFVVLSALLWCAAFTIFVVRYASLLLRPRVDGKPG